MPSELSTYFAKAMALYVHGFDHKFIEATRVWCHLIDGGSVRKIGTQPCWRPHNLFQWMMEVLRNAKKNCIESRPKVHKCILEAFVKNGWNKTKVIHRLPSPNGWGCDACHWSFDPIFKEFGECGPTILGSLCGSVGVLLQCNHALGDHLVTFCGGLWSGVRSNLII